MWITIDKIKKEFNKQIWIEIILTLILYLSSIICDHSKPHHMYIPNQETNPMISYPFYSLETFPYPICCIISVVVPSIFVYFFAKKRDSPKYLVIGILAVVFTFSLTRSVTDLLKLYAGRPRPNFTEMTKAGYAVDAYKSFPSGHTATMFNSMLFLSLLLYGEFKIFVGNGSLSKMLLCSLPLLFACIVGISRTRDYYHNFDDVVAGALIGSVLAYFTYCSKFESLTSKYAGEMEIKTGDYLDLEDEEIYLTQY